MIPLKILFVCVENANRSQMAEAFCRFFGGRQVLALSAGSEPSGTVNPKAIRSMGEIGIDLTSQRSHGFEKVPTDIDIVVTMGCGDACPIVPAKQRVDWNIPDPKLLPPEAFNEIRDTIAEHVSKLLVEHGVMIKAPYPNET